MSTVSVWGTSSRAPGGKGPVEERAGVGGCVRSVCVWGRGNTGKPGERLAWQLPTPDGCESMARGGTEG